VRFWRSSAGTGFQSEMLIFLGKSKLDSIFSKSLLYSVNFGLVLACGLFLSSSFTFKKFKKSLTEREVQPRHSEFWIVWAICSLDCQYFAIAKSSWAFSSISFNPKVVCNSPFLPSNSFFNFSFSASSFTISFSLFSMTVLSVFNIFSLFSMTVLSVFNIFSLFSIVLSNSSPFFF